MSHKSKVVFAVLAVAATLGAAQLAAGEAISSANLADRFPAVGESAGATAINRTSKGDRETQAATAAATRTVLLKVESLAGTSVLVRIPVQKDARNLPPAQSTSKSAADKTRKMTVACEPPVSVLTEVAKLLQPGRCVT
ncbi:hypothetical protein ES703_37922 [subsurface metagenome]|jgi:hypothetical protein|nr:MAG: hypothetical protein DI543_17235 [Bradyrhizobium icense]